MNKAGQLMQLTVVNKIILGFASFGCSATPLSGDAAPGTRRDKTTANFRVHEHKTAARRHRNAGRLGELLGSG